MAKAKRPAKRASTGSRKATGGGGQDPLLERTLAAVEGHARMAGVSSVQYIRGVMTGRYPRLSPRELGEE